MLYKVTAKTNRTDWVKIKTFDNEKDAKELARQIVNSDAGTVVCIETLEDK